VLALIRGDLEVNEAKVAKLIQAVPAAASETKIASAGAVAGFATPMGLDPARCRVLVDWTVAESANLVCGANEEDYHFKGFNLSRDLAEAEPVDIADVADGAGCPVCEGTLRLKRGIEVGNIFQLGAKYTEAMNMTYTDEHGEIRHPVMGCYGIGVGRLMASVMEARHDEYGPQWPLSIAPWHVHISALKRDAAPVQEAADSLYEDLQRAGVEVLYDDRNATAGVQFADADLLGAPMRIIVSPRNLKKDCVEYKRRDTGERGEISVDAAVDAIRNWIAGALRQLAAGASA